MNRREFFQSSAAVAACAALAAVKPPVDLWVLLEELAETYDGPVTSVHSMTMTWLEFIDNDDDVGLIVRALDR